MKTKLILAVLLAFSLNLKAQVARLGIMGGVSTEAVKITQVPNGVTNLIKGSGIVGGELGVFAKIKIILPVYLKPEALLHYANGTVLVQYADGNNTDVTFSYLKAEVPVIVGLQILGPVSIEGGPVYNYNIIASKNFNGQKVTVQPDGWGYRAGAGVQLGNVILFDMFLQGQGNSATSTKAAFKVPYSIVADLGIIF